MNSKCKNSKRKNSRSKSSKKMQYLRRLFQTNDYSIQPDSPLLNAIKCEKGEAVIKSLLAEENERNHRTGPVTDFELALCVALQQNAKNIVKIMLDADASLEGCIKHPSVIHCYLEKPRSGLKEDMLDLLIQRGGDRLISKVDNQKSLLCFALSSGADVNDIKLLLKKGVNFNGCSFHKSPMICLTCTSRCRLIKESVVKLLHDLGAEVNITDHIMRYTPLEHALATCIFEIGALKVLFNLQSGHLDVSTKELLHCAVRNYACKLKTVKFLVAQGIEPNSTDKRGKTPLHYAAMHYNSKEIISIIKFLMDKGGLVNKKSPYDLTPLREVVTKRARDYHILKVLVDASVEETDENSIL